MQKVVEFLNNIQQGDNVIHISHIDLDGYGSSYLVGEYLEKQTNLMQDNTNYGQIVDKLLDYDIEEETIVIITDLNLTLDECVHLDSRTKRWMVIDHHGTGQESADQYSQNYYLNTEYCATQLTYNIFDLSKFKAEGYRDEHLRNIAYIVNIYDLWQKKFDEDFKMGMLMSLYVDKNPFESNKLKHRYNRWLFENIFVYLLDYGVQATEISYQETFLDWISCQEDEEYLHDTKLPTAIKVALLHTPIMKDHIAYSIGEVVIFTGLSTNVTQYTFDKLMDSDEYADKVLINLNTRNGKMSIRSRNEHASYYAKHLGGGGHPNAAGAKVECDDGSYLAHLIHAIENMGPDNGSLEYLISLNVLLKKYNISFEQFTQFSKKEKFNEEEVNDLGYLEDKMAIWQEMIK